MYKIKYRSKHNKRYNPINKNQETKTCFNINTDELYEVFRKCPELEEKYLALMKLPITGREPIQIPFDLTTHHQHTCLDFSPYANEQISRSVCSKCEHLTFPTPSDSVVAFMNQSANFMHNRLYYYGFKKNTELVKLSTQQPTIFQIFHTVYATNTEIFPIMFSEKNMLHMYIIFESQNTHLSCECIKNIIAIAEDYSVSLDIIGENLVMSVICINIRKNLITIDAEILQRKFEELDIPPQVNEKYETHMKKFHTLLL
ncbi:nuclear egress lamina protein [Murid herpesvirus 3]|uniref:Nuclear egress lamina protein n=2 Tax=Murid betaherpesvirus 3 TaxID=2560603 RepID=A0A1P8VIV3_9BETA|nr:nuclear egress lamina protein [Murine roseolovirus]APZ76265.1 nuclear egress lamina protein [Murid betaherpesvirus 3]AYH64776.1 nuclear egress lamina protein [Murid herpesvirus 3]